MERERLLPVLNQGPKGHCNSNNNIYKKGSGCKSETPNAHAVGANG